MKTTRAMMLIASGLLLAIGCTGAEKHSEGSPDATPAKVRLTAMERLDRMSYNELMGTVVARRRAEIQTKVQSRVERIAVSIGSRVREGDLLIEFDTRETNARVQQANALHDQAAQDLKRFETLLAQGAVTQQEYDAVKARNEIAEAGLQEARAMSTYARITAPFSGTITRKDISEGDLVVPGRPLLTLEDESSLQLLVSIPESQRAHLRTGDTLDVRDSDGDSIVRAVVEELSPSADPISRSLTAKLSLPPNERLHAGQFARLLLPGGRDAGAALPASAVVQRGQLELVFTVTSENRASLKLVRTGRTLGDKIEILSGLRGDERVIIDPPTTLGDHDPVEVMP